MVVNKDTCVGLFGDEITNMIIESEIPDGTHALYVHIVPKEVNKKRDKYYIGITKQRPVSTRWGSNGVRYKNIHFHNAINLYGWNNIEHIIITENLSEEDAKIIEQKCIAYTNSRDRDYGYNRSIGGDTGSKFIEIPVNQYDLYGNYIKTFPSASEAGRNVGKDRTNITHAIRCNKLVAGYQWSYADKKSMEPYQRENQKWIAKFNLQGEYITRYPSIKVAADNSDTTRDNIHHAVRHKTGRSNIAGSYRWLYVTEYDRTGVSVINAKR